MRIFSFAFSFLLVSSTSHAQVYGVAIADDLKSLSDFRIGATCESIQAQLESRDAETFPELRYICKGKGYRTFKVYRYAQDSTYVFSLAPDSTVWKIGLYTNRSDKSIQSNVDAMQMFYDNFGRPVLEEDISVGGTISTLDGLKSFGKLVFKHAWATSHLNPTTTINTISRLGCQRPPKINPACFSKHAKDSEENWDKELAKLDGIVVIGKFSPAKEGMERFSIESYQKEHLEKSTLLLRNQK